MNKHHIALSFYLSILSFFVTAQQPVAVTWQEMTPISGAVSSFANCNGRMWAVADFLFYSDDEGVSWQRYEHPDAEQIRSVACGEFGVVFHKSRLERHGSGPSASLYQYDIFLKQNNSDTTDFENVLSNPASAPGVDLLNKTDTELLRLIKSSSQNTLFFSVKSSTDGGLNWQDFNVQWNPDNHKTILYNIQEGQLYTLRTNQATDKTELHYYTEDNVLAESFIFDAPTEEQIASFGYWDNKVLLMTKSGILFTSSDQGENWTSINYFFTEPNNQHTYKFTSEGIGAAVRDSLWWINYNNTDLAEFIFTDGHENLSFDLVDDLLTVSTNRGLYLRFPGTGDFQFRSQGIAGKITDLRSHNEALYAKTAIWHKSMDDGQSWSLSDTSFTNNIYQLNNNLVKIDMDGLHASSDQGVTWNFIGSYNIYNVNNGLIVASDGWYFYDHSNLYYTSDGANFVERNSPTGSGQIFWRNDRLISIANSQLYYSINGGINWLSEFIYGDNDGFILPQTDHLMQLNGNENVTYIYHSFDEGITWTNGENNLRPYSYYPKKYQPRHDKKMGGIDFFKGREFSATRNSGDDISSLNGPFFYRVNADLQLDVRYYEIPIPTSTAEHKGYLYVSSDNRKIFRTSLDSLYTQLSDTIIQKGVIIGTLFKDKNDNCELDSLDFALANKVISIHDKTILTNDVGKFATQLPFSANFGNYEYYTDSVVHTFNNCTNHRFGNRPINGQMRDTLDIAFTLIPDIIDGEINSWNTSTFRPGFNTPFRIKVKNKGTEDIINQTLKLDFEDQYLIMESFSQGQLTNAGTWESQVSVLTDEEMILTFNFLTKTDAPLGTLLNFESVLILDDDINPENNLFTLNKKVVGSFDPNDKTVTSRTGVYPEKANQLNYRIRFQNTGTDTAFRVSVVDTLPAGLNIYSLEMLDASHNYDLSIRPPNIITWTFNNIYLVDSITNEPDSHGFIAFTIATDQEVMDGDSLLNRAGIYFDYNDPIITEYSRIDVQKGIYYAPPVNLEFCEGDIWNGMIFEEDLVLTDTVFNGQIDSIYTLNITVNPNSFVTTQWEGIAGDTILGIPVFQDTTITSNFLNFWGCDSIVVIEISVTPLSIDPALEQEHLSIFPNPATNDITIRFNTEQTGEIALNIYDLTGKKWGNNFTYYKNNIQPLNWNLPLPNLPTGLYFLQIKMMDKIHYLKLEKIE